MPDEQADIDPGLYDEEPSAEELAEEEAARSVVSVADMVQEHLDDPATPSRRTADGSPAPGSFDVDMETPS
jgi:hypothetical protein